MAITQIRESNIQDDAVTTTKIAPGTVLPSDLDPTQSYTMAGLQVNGTVTTTEQIDSPATPPVGTIIAFYDFNAALSFNATYWSYCDGSAVTVEGIGVQTLPDLSGRYMVGFGTDGGGDIDTAGWATAAVGNASHQINIQHSHTGNSHSHTVNSHTHDVNIGSFTSGGGGVAHTHSVNPPNRTSGGPSNNTSGTGSSHSHGPGSLRWRVLRADNVGGVVNYQGWNISDVVTDMMRTDNNGVSDGTGTGIKTDNPPGSGSTQYYYTNSGSGSSATESSHAHSLSSHTHDTDIGSFTSGGASATSHTHSVDPGNTTSTGTAPGTNSQSPGTDNQLSTTQSIQPRSIRVRYIMRIK